MVEHHAGQLYGAVCSLFNRVTVTEGAPYAKRQPGRRVACLVATTDPMIHSVRRVTQSVTSSSSSSI